MPITLDGTNGITTPMYNGSIAANAVTPSVNMKNRIINGAMVIDQRNAGASVTPSSSLTYTLDRWRADMSTGSKFSVQRSSIAPAGFTNSLLITSTSAYTVGASDFFALTQAIEGFNTADLDFGTANAKTVTLSFWVRSSLTGTFSGVLVNSNDTRVYPFTFTVNSANTFEQKSVTIAGDTSGTWQTTSSAGIRVQFYIGLGTNFQGSVNAWNSGTVYGASGTTNLVSTNGATFYLTGVQLEVGSTATSFDYRPYGTELALCQRYYWKIIQGTGVGGGYGIAGYNTVGNGVWQTFGFPVTMRASPTVTVYGTWAVSNCSQPVIAGSGPSNFILQTVATATAALAVYPNTSDDLIDASAEL